MARLHSRKARKLRRRQREQEIAAARTLIEQGTEPGPPLMVWQDFTAAILNHSWMAKIDVQA